jgi:hypothetical protein
MWLSSSRAFNWYLAASISPASLSATSGESPISTSSALAMGLEGSGLYTYAWNWSSGGSGIAISAPSAATTHFTVSGTTPATYIGTAQCTVTDIESELTARAYVSISIQLLSSLPGNAIPGYMIPGNH